MKILSCVIYIILFPDIFIKMCFTLCCTLLYGAVGKQNKLYPARSGEVVKHEGEVLDTDMETEPGEKMEHRHEEVQIMFGCSIVGNAWVSEQTLEMQHALLYVASPPDTSQSPPRPRSR